MLKDADIHLQHGVHTLDTLVVRASTVQLSAGYTSTGLIVVGALSSYNRRRNTLFNELKKVIRRRKIRRMESADERMAKKAARKARRTEAAANSSLATSLEQKIIAENTATTSQQNPFAVYPNPATGPITLQFKSEAETQLMLEVINAAGQAVYLAPWRVVAGPNQLTLARTESFKTAGTYVIRLVGEKEQWSQRLVVE